MRDLPSEEPPPPPYDIFLTRKERRVYRRRGAIRFTVSKEATPVYYHPLRKCIEEKYGEANSGNVSIKEIKSSLEKGHKDILRKEFGIIV